MAGGTDAGAAQERLSTHDAATAALGNENSHSSIGCGTNKSCVRNTRGDSHVDMTTSRGPTVQRVAVAGLDPCAGELIPRCEY